MQQCGDGNGRDVSLSQCIITQMHSHHVCSFKGINLLFLALPHPGRTQMHSHHHACSFKIYLCSSPSIPDGRVLPWFLSIITWCLTLLLLPPHQNSSHHHAAAAAAAVHWSLLKPGARGLNKVRREELCCDLVHPGLRERP